MVNKLDRILTSFSAQKIKSKKQEISTNQETTLNFSLNDILVKYKDADIEVKKKQIITHILIKKFGKNIVLEPKFNKLLNSLNNKFSTTDSLKELLNQLSNKQ